MPKLKRTTPCSACPWLRKSVPGYLGEDNPVNFYRVSVTRESEMPCHMAIDYSDPEWVMSQLPDADFCAGNLIYYRNNCKSPRRLSVAEAVHAVKQSPHVFSWPHEFLDHHVLDKNADITELVRKATWPYSDEDE